MNVIDYRISKRVASFRESNPKNTESFFNKLFHLNNNGDGKNPLEKLNTLKACLDNIQMNVFVADKDLNLIYMNDIAKKTITSIEPELRKEFGIGVDELLGGAFTGFIKTLVVWRGF